MSFSLRVVQFSNCAMIKGCPCANEDDEENRYSFAQLKKRGKGGEHFNEFQ